MALNRGSVSLNIEQMPTHKSECDSHEIRTKPHSERLLPSHLPMG